MNKVSYRNREKLQTINKELLYTDLFSAYPEALFLLDTSGEFVELNDGLVKLLGYPKDKLLYSHFTDYIFQEDVADVKGYFFNALRGKDQERQIRVMHENGNIKYVSVKVVPAKIKGEILGVYGVAKDISEKKELEAALRKSEMRFESLINRSTDVIGIIDHRGIIKYQSPAVEQVLGYDPCKLNGTTVFELVCKEDLKAAQNLFYSVLNRPNITQRGELKIKTSDGGFIYCEAYVTNLLEDENVNGIVINYRDISSRKTQEEEIQKMAYHDYLTGLPNRFMLEKNFSNVIREHEELAILFIDLDRFKVINDNMGHHVGDLLIKEVTKRLKSCLADNDFLFRQGGDEFIIILTNANRELAANVSKNIVASLSYPFLINDYDIFTSPSIGISMFPEDGQSVEQLTRNSDYAMYQAKKMGRNTFYFYSERELGSINPLSIEMDLHSALERNELELHYQPKVSLKTGEVVGVEALMRWNHPKWGMVSPATFIPIAEESGLIVSVGEWALRTACLQNKRLSSQGYEIVMSVNLSPRQFNKINLVQTIENILKETELQPQLLELEITESMTTNIEQTIGTLHELKSLGVKISIDDFGTGFSSLNYLKQFPVDTLKIDQSFVRELSNKDDETIVKTIISMAHNLNLNVVAEGIETKEQVEFLKQHLCNEGQGYFFSKPVPEVELMGNIQQIQENPAKLGVTVEPIQKENESLSFKEENCLLSENQAKTEKIGVAGELAAGIAHEIRNPITSIKGFIHLFEKGVIKKDYFDVIHSSFQQIEEVLKEFLTLSKPEMNERKLVDMNALIQDVIVEVGKYDGIQIIHENEEKVPKIMCDPIKIKEVFTHIITNSTEAIVQDGVVNIEVRTDESSLLVTITDNGIGISKDRLERLGEPFFSLKEKGIGLGLMVCYQTIWLHNGSIQVRSEENKGTQVEVRFPIGF
ncbi:EAL domain-containing protein [Halalkalibacter alkaliphilus]|uniref:histidine kinase n=1 Tax=Halalkalibacter alkaliphilus TaxID=2917993 RepID=A0A9X2I8L9_9BACI|nr:EAL domain-containing protein [Halalkalibacter alkaliphilus]MCL7748944.1 EAL domain-containing protein [Halalkalibacter alkaliphilus]